MITGDGVEIRGDVQPQEAGGGEEDYAKPFGVPESKEESLGLKDPPVRPTTRLERFKRWRRRHVYLDWSWWFS